MKVINSEKLDVLDFPPIGIKFLLEDLLEEARNHTIDFEFGGEHYGEFKYENACKLLGKAMIEFPGIYNFKGRKITDKDRKYLGWSK